MYALACGFGFHDAARIAARRSLRLPFKLHVEFVDELRYASAAAYHRLSDYRRRCTEAVRALPTWVVLPPLWIMGDGTVRSLLRGSSTATGMIVLIPAAQLTRREASHESVATCTHSAWPEATERLGKMVDERVDIILLPLLPISSTHSYVPAMAPAVFRDKLGSSRWRMHSRRCLITSNRRR